MKWSAFLIYVLISASTYAQQTPLPHGMVFGLKPDTSNMVQAAKMLTFMDNKQRVSTTLMGKVVNVKKEKGGWFDVDAGGGKVISAHFKNYDVSLPVALKGRVVIIQGIANKKHSSTNMLGLTGDAVTAKKNIQDNKASILNFEVTGLMVYQ